MFEMKNVELRQGGFHLSAHFLLESETRCAVIGPSGAGKSTLLMGLAGFLVPAQGEIFWNGVDITNMPPSERPFSVLFQDNNLFPHMDVSQNVSLGIRPSMRLSAQEVSYVEGALEAVGLDGMGARKPAELSGGQQSRVALARVLVQRKPMLLLDEPFAALGPALKAEMLDWVAALCTETGAGLLMVSHEPSDAERVCEQTIFVAQGCAHSPVDTSVLMNNLPTALQSYLGK